ncbi:type 1 glutamine amidotransferase [Halomonas campisalis]|uniref:Type 1 glutamine amidotransferase n=1 Tax=Billgrantia campisalis TaxID=74661 RepID=A0ABS9PDH7_9GAMM|nr:type 1 glutamine amidotransferase [Halomonas campisalis]MCG6659821.1 type 1 glutamine amidotransferase [Halomonas campisalis]MDR5864989.1 type 1 glutamine amidotransferase [Halomonas campisalis]
MHVHLLQHSDFQGPGRIADWLTSMGHSHTVFHLHAGEAPPSLADCDALIVLDGPPGSEDEAELPWLKRERKLIGRALDGNKPLLGIGLGARLIAEALGAAVGRGSFTEVGWHEVTRSAQSPFDLPERFTAFMWHQRVFALPDDALPLGGSQASPVQGFAWDGGRALGLLCHLEVTRAGVAELLDSAEPPQGDAAGPNVQPREAILAEGARFDRLAPLLDRLLSQWLSTARA